MRTETKHFRKAYRPIYDTIARADIPQETRERIACDLTEALKGQPDFNPDLFWHLCADPLVRCGGPDGTGCPHKREIRISMYVGWQRSIWWSPYPPRVNCVSCGPVKQEERDAD